MALSPLVRSILRGVTALSVFALVVGRASAQLSTMQVDFAFGTGFYQGGIKFDPTLSGSPSDLQAYFSGLTVSPVSPTATTLGLPNSFLSYCIDLRDAITVPGLNTFVVDSTANITTASPSLIVRSNASPDAAAWLYNNYAPTIGNGFDSAALQMAIWEVMYDWDGTVPGLAGLSLSTGNFQLAQLEDDAGNIVNPATFTAQVQTYLNTWNGQTDVALWLRGDPVKQDLIGSRIPEPGTLSLLALSGLLFVRKGTRRRSHCC